MVLIIIAHIINILVAGNFGILIFFRQNRRIDPVYGEETAGRQILGCIYLAIAIMSVWALVDVSLTIEIAKVLFPMQIVYKLLTLIAVRNKKNPVPWANLGISIFHAIALISIWNL